MNRSRKSSKIAWIEIGKQTVKYIKRILKVSVSELDTQIQIYF